MHWLCVQKVRGQRHRVNKWAASMGLQVDMTAYHFSLYQCDAGWKADIFSWKEYLSYCGAEAAPADAFTMVSCDSLIFLPVVFIFYVLSVYLSFVAYFFLIVVIYTRSVVSTDVIYWMDWYPKWPIMYWMLHRGDMLRCKIARPESSPPFIGTAFSSPAFSGIAFSNPAIWSHKFPSCIFQPWDLILHFPVLLFLVLHFQHPNQPIP